MASSVSIDEEKRALRRAMDQQRNALDPAERLRRSKEVCDRLMALPEFGAAAVISGFQAMRSEVDPSHARQAAQRRGASIVFPRVTKLVPRLRFHSVAGPQDLVPGPFGLLEPTEHCPEVPVDAIDFIVAPGLAFDGGGRRLGYGGGYYDEIATAVRARRGAEQKKGYLVGIGFDFQLVDRCPVGQGDVAIDFVVTDARVVRCDFSFT